MPTIDAKQDAFGRALQDQFEGRSPQPLELETDAGRVTPAMAPEWFFLDSSQWHPFERQQLESLTGPVLDLGAGAGRASLWLQEGGIDTIAVDSSPGAAAVCRARGIHDVRCLDFIENLPDDRPWQSVLLLCGNLGLAGSWNETRNFLRRLHARCSPGAVIIADTVDPTVYTDAEIRAYQQQRIAAGDYLGQVTLRLRYGRVISPWWSLLNVRVDDMAALLQDTGWHLTEHEVAGVDHYVRLTRMDIA